MFICGDNAEAEQQVIGIIRRFGWEPCDCGGIMASGALEPRCILWCLGGFQHNYWYHAFKLS
jgi:predicted dinucleotide-binding enzyme